MRRTSSLCDDSASFEMCRLECQQERLEGCVSSIFFVFPNVRAFAHVSLWSPPGTQPRPFILLPFPFIQMALHADKREFPQPRQ